MNLFGGSQKRNDKRVMRQVRSDGGLSEEEREVTEQIPIRVPQDKDSVFNSETEF